MLNVNTIAFNGRKAVLNSYSDHPELRASMERQQAEFAARYPNATVKTERMPYADCVALVAVAEAAKKISRMELAYDIARESEAA